MLALRLGELGYVVVATCLNDAGAQGLSAAAAAHKVPVLGAAGSSSSSSVSGGIRTVLMDVCKAEDIDRVRDLIEAEYPHGVQYVDNQPRARGPKGSTLCVSHTHADIVLW
jgi:NAD(P)-dependent dehydrogenase (short-subunit alcohol dehydrogenase family)